MIYVYVTWFGCHQAVIAYCILFYKGAAEYTTSASIITKFLLSIGMCLGSAGLHSVAPQAYLLRQSALIAFHRQ